MKRFYKMAGYGPAADKFPILLDGKPARTPAGAVLSGGVEPLAAAICDEWQDQKEHIDPKSMPLTQLRITCLDFVAGKHEKIIEDIMAFTDTDLLLYHTPEPKALAQRQEEIWGRWLDWVGRSYEVCLTPTHALAVIKQDEAWHRALRRYLSGLDTDRLAIFYVVAALGKSVIMPLAFLEDAANPDDMLEALRLEEIYNHTHYGDDGPGTVDVDERFLGDMIAARKYLALLP